MSDNKIVHRGIIRDFGKTRGSWVEAKVEIQPQSACGSCAAKGSCSASKGGRILDTLFSGSGDLGDQVRVEMHSSLGWKAVFFAFGLPLTIIMVLFFSIQNWTNWGEIPASIYSLAGLGPYYFLLSLMQKKHRKEFQFYSYKIV